MKSLISRDTEFEDFVQQIEDGQEAMSLQNPYNDIQIVTIAKNLIESTGFYTTYCREWNGTDNAQKTWVNFKVHFSRAFRENRDQSRQAQHAGYGHTNTQNLANAAMLAEMTQYHSHALANLSTDEYQQITYLTLNILPRWAKLGSYVLYHRFPLDPFGTFLS